MKTGKISKIEIVFKNLYKYSSDYFNNAVLKTEIICDVIVFIEISEDD